MNITDLSRSFQIIAEQTRARALSFQFKKMDADARRNARYIKGDREFIFWVIRYIFTGSSVYLVNSGTGVIYPGMSSTNGPKRDAMEGFSRVAPLASAWIRGQGKTQIECLNGETFNLERFICNGIANGTNPKHEHYWGDIRSRDQILAESSDIAISVWLIWDKIESLFTSIEKTNLFNWLEGAISCDVKYGNWLLFQIIAQAVLYKFTGRLDTSLFNERWDRIKSMRREGGWYTDGEGEIFDYYNAWAFHYSFFWLYKIDKDLAIRQFAIDDMRVFVKEYKYLSSRFGFPMMGRSICFRLACSAPLVCESLMPNAEISPGLARTSLLADWRYFIRNGSLKNGTITQGYFHSDERLLENYSGPASPLWSLRSLIPAIAFGAEGGLWTAPGDSLEVEKSDFSLFLNAPKWRVSGDKASGNVRITTAAATNDNKLSGRSVFRIIKDVVRGYPSRNENKPYKYSNRSYDSIKFYK